MQANRSRDTKPELSIRRAVHAMGLRYRVAERPIKQLPRSGDLVFSRARVVVFVDGCFWHGCPLHYIAPRANAEFWKAKIERNRERDAETSAVLNSQGWIVLRFWGHEDPSTAAEKIRRAVELRRGTSREDGNRREPP